MKSKGDTESWTSMSKASPTACIIVAAMSMLMAAPGLAFVGPSVVPNYPSTVVVGPTYSPVSLKIQYLSSDPSTEGICAPALAATALILATLLGGGVWFVRRRVTSRGNGAMMGLGVPAGIAANSSAAPSSIE